MPETLEIRDLQVSIEGLQILKGVDLTIKQGEIHALMGPNVTALLASWFSLATGD